MVMSPVGLRINNYYAGEDQQQGLNRPKIMDNAKYNNYIGANILYKLFINLNEALI
jgi:hypothetical protein